MTYGEIAQISAAVAAICATIISLINRRKLTEIRLQVNGRIDELLKITATSNHAAGVLEERNRKNDEL